MDSLTHLVLGAAIGEAVLGKKIGRKAMLWGAVADTIPDLDVFASPCFTNAQQLMVHRGITHSLLFVVVMAPLLGWLFSKWFKKSEVSWKSWTWLFFFGLLSHTLLDSLTAYGTGWFEPFSAYRVAFNTIFVADPFYTLPFLICVIVALIAKNGSDKRLKWNKAGLVISTLYLAFTIVNKWHVHDEMHDSFVKKNLQTASFVTTPTPLNNFLWMAYSADSLGYWFGYYSVFDKTNNIDYYHVNRNESLLVPYKNDPQVKILKQFSKGHYCMTINDSSDVYFNDIRFGQMGGWDKPDSAFVFSFKLNNDADNAMALDRSKLKMSYSDAISSLVTRIKGK
ncbi:MAG: metal-dependent hydrolase [Bacteroidota bacterium]|nr:metal-dependent hydrolase [Bacteroidota bacterium]